MIRQQSEFGTGCQNKRAFRGGSRDGRVSAPTLDRTATQLLQWTADHQRLTIYPLFTDSKEICHICSIFLGSHSAVEVGGSGGTLKL